MTARLLTNASARRRVLAAGCAIASAVALNACSTARPATTGAGPDGAFGEWSGRFSITLVAPDGADTEQQSNEDRAQGRFELSRQPGRLNLALFSPFGQTMATASAVPGRATLTTAKGQVFEAQNSTRLVEQALGWRLPVDALPGWLAGERLAADNKAVTLDGWRVRVEKRMTSGKPRVLAASWPENPKADKHQLKLLVVVDGR